MTMSTDTVFPALRHLKEPDCVNSEGNTPLHWACLNGHPEVIHSFPINCYYVQHQYINIISENRL